MSWQDQVGPGWRKIVGDAVAGIVGYKGTILEVKEKFGGLRIYFTCPSETMTQAQAIRDAAEAKCARTCERCGGPGKLREELSWLKTLCEEHLIAEQLRYGRR